MNWQLKKACKNMFIMHAIGLSIVGITFLSTTDAFGGQLDLIIGSKHSQAEYWGVDQVKHEYNEVNPGVAYTTDSGWVVGIYKNSYHKTTVLAGHAFETKAKYLNVGVALGGATGYENVSNMVVTPMAMPYVMVGPKAIRAKIGVIPGRVPVFTFMININY